jgi:hypothetical protein
MQKKLDNKAILSRYNEALSGLKSNVWKVFGYEHPVLVEGGGYPGVWLECAPLEGLIYGRFDAETARDLCVFPLLNCGVFAAHVDAPHWEAWAALLAESLRWVPLRDLAWAASVGWGFGLIRWLDPMIDGAAGVWRWLLMAADLLCLAVCVLVAPALLFGLARRLRPPEPPPLPVERPATHPRQWGPKDEA